jgi:hypothetical protein
MDRKLAQWKLDIERFCSAPAPDYEEAARLAAVIARVGEEAVLCHAATQAQPILRNASLGNPDTRTQDAARRRLGVIRDVLHTLTTPQFGQRQDTPKQLTPEEHHRQMLGLPLGGGLSAPEIHQAWKRAAKTSHPDAGGDAGEFLALSAARDALIKQIRLVRSS